MALTSGTRLDPYEIVECRDDAPTLRSQPDPATLDQTDLSATVFGGRLEWDHAERRARRQTR